MRQLWMLAWKNVGVYRRRHFFTGLGLASGFCCLILLGGYMLRMESYLATHTIYLRQMGHVSIWKKDAVKFFFQNPEKYSFSAEEKVKINNIFSVLLKKNDRVIEVLSGMGMLTNGCRSLPVIFTGVEPEDMKWLYSRPDVLREIPELTRMVRGSPYWEVDPSKVPINISPGIFNLLKKENLIQDNPEPTSLLTNCDNSESLQQMARDPFVQIFTQALDGGLGVTDAALAGLVNTGFTFADETALNMSLTAAKNLLRTDHVSRFSVVLADGEQSFKIKTDLDEALRTAGINDVQVYHYTHEDVSEIYVGAMNFVYVMMGFFLFLVCGVVILSIANSFQISFLERKIEFATFRSVGFRSKTMQIILLFEYIQVAAISFAFGGLFAFVLKSLNNAMNFRFRIPGFSNDLQFILQPSPLFTYLVAGGMLLLVIISSWFFSTKTMKIKVIDLLRADP